MSLNIGFWLVPIAAASLVTTPLPNNESAIIDSNEVESRIYFGTPVSIKHHPYFAGVYSGGICGGVIISSVSVLTAAHCLIDGSRFKDFVTVGGDTLDNSISVRVWKKHKHPDYRNEGQIHDIALLLLKRQLVFSDRIQPVRLPMYSPTIPSSGYVAIGRGRDESGGISKRLMAIKVRVHPTSECRNSGEESSPDSSEESLQSEMSLVCVIRKKNMPSICSGDSGSPLVKNYIVWGLAASSHDSNIEHCGINRSLYTNVTTYVPWINDIMSQYINY